MHDTEKGSSYLGGTSSSESSYRRAAVRFASRYLHIDFRTGKPPSFTFKLYYSSSSISHRANKKCLKNTYNTIHLFIRNDDPG